VLFSCQKLEDYNKNPNELTFVTALSLLNYSTYSLANDHRFNMTWKNLFCQHFSQPGISQSDPNLYELHPYQVNDFFKTSYHSILDLQEIIRLCAEDPDAQRVGGDPVNQVAQARILRAWKFQNMTDYWGDIPYSETLAGKLAPRYDTQESIYHDLLRELEEAAAQIRLDAPPLSADARYADGIYLGYVGGWKKFANSLTLRVAIRMADRDWPAAKVAIEKAFADGVFENNYDNAWYVFLLPPSNYQNPYAQFKNYIFVSKPLMDVLKGLEDPRIPKYAAPAKNTGDYEGLPYGLTLSNQSDRDNYSNLNETAAAPDGRVVLLDYVEVCFALAEAIERGAAIPGSAAEWYHKGIRASMEWWGVDPADIDVYLARTDVNYDTAPGTWKEKIGKQKWLALFMQGEQAWFEWRRLDFGILQPPPGLDYIATRYIYPDLEQILNKASYDEAVIRLPGGDKVTSKVWWDVN